MVNKGENWDSGIVSMLPTFLVIFLGPGAGGRGGGNENSHFYYVLMSAL